MRGGKNYLSPPCGERSDCATIRVRGRAGYSEHRRWAPSPQPSPHARGEGEDLAARRDWRKSVASLPSPLPPRFRRQPNTVGGRNNAAPTSGIGWFRRDNATTLHSRTSCWSACHVQSQFRRRSAANFQRPAAGAAIVDRASCNFWAARCTDCRCGDAVVASAKSFMRF